MILTDTAGAAFDKVAKGLTPIKIGHNYILTVQDLLAKFFVAIPLEQTTAIHIVDVFIRNFTHILDPLHIKGSEYL